MVSKQEKNEHDSAFFVYYWKTYVAKYTIHLANEQIVVIAVVVAVVVVVIKFGIRIRTGQYTLLTACKVEPFGLRLGNK